MELNLIKSTHLEGKRFQSTLNKANHLVERIDCLHAFLTRRLNIPQSKPGEVVESAEEIVTDK